MKFGEKFLCIGIVAFLCTSIISLFVDASEGDRIVGTVKVYNDNAIISYEAQGEKVSVSEKDGLMALKIDGVEMTVNDATAIVEGSELVSADENAAPENKIVIVRQGENLIAAYQGYEVTIYESRDIPETTMVFIDGNRLYVHNAEVSICDADSMK